MANCEECCEALECRADALETNVTNLFLFADQIKTYLEDNESNITANGAYFLVTNEEELITALAQSATDGRGNIVIQGDEDYGMIEINQTHTITDNIWFFGGGFTYPHTASATNIALRIEGTGIRFFGVRWDMNHPLVPRVVGSGLGNSTFDKHTCVDISQDDDCSGLEFHDCTFVNFYGGIKRWEWGGGFEVAAPYSDHCKIKGCKFIGFVGVAIYARGRMRYLSVTETFFSGWNVAESAIPATDVMHYDAEGAGGNAVWVGEQCDYFIFENNDVTQVDRHGVEYWNSTVAGGNKNPRINNNRFLQVRSFGISAFGAGIIQIFNNVLDEIGYIGIETFQDANNTGIPHVIGNTIKRVVAWRTLDAIDGSAIPYAGCLGISVNGVSNGIYRNNYIGLCSVRVPSTSTGSDNYSRGIQTTGTCINNVIENNELVDAGDHMLLFNSNSDTTHYNNIVNNNTFRRTTDAYLSTTTTGATIGFTTAIWFIKVIAIAKDNVLLCKVGLLSAGAGGGFRNNGDATVYSGRAVDAATVLTGPHNVSHTANAEIYGSNITLTHA